MTTYILKRKVFADLDFKDFSKFLEEVKGYKKGNDGKFADWNTYKSDQGLIKEYETWREGLKAKAKEALSKENEAIAKNSLYNRGKEFAKDVWEKHGKSIKIGGGVIAASGLGYGAYKYVKGKNADRRERELNDKLRKRIVG